MSCTRVTATTTACLLLCHAGLGHVTAARQVPVEPAHREPALPRTVAASISAGSKISASRPPTPTILHLATVQEQVDMDPELTEFRKLMQDCGATFYLEQSRDMTAFMPTNEAIRALLPVDVHKLPWEVKWRILQYHIVPQDIVNVEEIPWGATKIVKTWEGSSIKIQHKKQPGQQRNSEGKTVELYLLNGIANIVSDPPRIENSNGASYKINRVLIPQDLDLRAYETKVSDQRQRGVDKQKKHQLTQYLRSHFSKKPVASCPDEEERVQTVTDAEHTEQKQALAACRRPRCTNTTTRCWRCYRTHFTPCADGSATESPLPASTSTTKALILDIVGPQPPAGHDKAGIGLPAAGLLHPPETSTFQNYMHLSLEPLLVGSGVQEDSILPQISTGADSAAPVSSSRPSSTSVSGSSSVLPLSSAAVVSASSPSNSAKEGRDSLFDSYQEFQSYVASPSIAALGLAEGLLPEEELVTHYWSKPRSSTGRLGITTPSKPYKSTSASFGPLSKLSGLMNFSEEP